MGDRGKAAMGGRTGDVSVNLETSRATEMSLNCAVNCIAKRSSPN